MFSPPSTVILRGETKGWVHAKDLDTTISIKLTSDSFALINFVTTFDTIAKVYNIEVADNHNYYITEQGLLVHNDCIGTLTSKSIKGVELLSGHIYKNGNELIVNISLIYKKEGYGGKVFANLLNHLDDIAKQHGTNSMTITFESITDKSTAQMYINQAAKYGFKIRLQKSPTFIPAAPSLDAVWYK